MHNPHNHTCKEKREERREKREERREKREESREKREESREKREKRRQKREERREMRKEIRDLIYISVAQHFVSSFWFFWFEPPIFQNRIFLLDDFRECANGFIRVATLFVNVAADHGDFDGMMLQIVQG